MLLNELKQFCRFLNVTDDEILDVSAGDVFGLNPDAEYSDESGLFDNAIVSKTITHVCLPVPVININCLYIGDETLDEMLEMNRKDVLDLVYCRKGLVIPEDNKKQAYSGIIPLCEAREAGCKALTGAEAIRYLLHRKNLPDVGITHDILPVFPAVLGSHFDDTGYLAYYTHVLLCVCRRIRSRFTVDDRRDEVISPCISEYYAIAIQELQEAADNMINCGLHSDPALKYDGTPHASMYELYLDLLHPDERPVKYSSEPVKTSGIDMSAMIQLTEQMRSYKTPSLSNGLSQFLKEAEARNKNRERVIRKAVKLALPYLLAYIHSNYPAYDRLAMLHATENSFMEAFEMNACRGEATLLDWLFGGIPARLCMEAKKETLME